MKTIKFTALLFAIAAIVSCQKDKIANNSDSSVVRLVAGVGSSFTRSNPVNDEASAAFKTGDVVCVSADSQEEVKYTLGVTTWTPEADKCLKWNANEMTFKAYYPVEVNGASMTTFDLPIDQTTIDKIEKADYMTYTSPAPEVKAESVNLELARKTSRVVVESTTFNDQYNTGGYTVDKIEISTNTSGYANGAVKSGDISISTYNSGGKFYALLCPTAADASKTFFTITVKKTADATTEILTVKGIPSLAAGNSYSYKLLIGKKGVKIADLTIKNWTTGAVIGKGDTRVAVDAKTSTIDLPFAGMLTEDMVRFAVNDVDKTIILKGKVSKEDLITIITAGNKIGTVHHIDFTDTESINSLTSGIFDGYDGNIPLYNLQSIKLSKTIYSIGQYSFYYCENLVSVDAPGIGRLYDNAFLNCEKLQTINAPNLTYVANYAFQTCVGLKYLYLTTPSNIDYQCFNLMYGRTLYLHENKKLNGSGTPTVEEDGVTWGGATWKEIKYVNDAGEVIE